MKTPVCPACGAKFSHNNTTASCSKCGLPDEVASEGGKAIARWKRNPYGIIGVVTPETGATIYQQWPLGMPSKRLRKRGRTSTHRRATRMHRPKHGRQHV